MNDDLLRKVREEIIENIHFTKKETDIYKVFQTGDLANLSGLDESELKLLPNCYKLRQALYSQEFRDFMTYVTGAGKLSGIKQDMSINTYSKGCHLLTHDDVIGSRRISYILYLPSPDKPWKVKWGGALRLFPNLIPNVPSPDFSLSCPPAFNQLAFFTVQPGVSFHDVEEVHIETNRMSIQGWFHIPQPGEDGFIEGEQEETEARSSLQQLQSKELQHFDFPKPILNKFSNDEINLLTQTFLSNNDSNSIKLTSDDLEILSKFLNPVLLSIEHIEHLNGVFSNTSILEIDDLLNKDYAKSIKKSILKAESNRTPQTSNEIKYPWKLAVPPHKFRYMYIDGLKEEDRSVEALEKLKKDNGPNEELPDLSSLSIHDKDITVQKLSELANYLKSTAFKKWLMLVSGLIPVSDKILIRRFRPGHDFSLATLTSDDDSKGNEGDILDALLEATLSITPTEGWESGELGGYELCMATTEDENDDPAVYRSSLSKRSAGEEEEDDDPVLLTSQASWNSMTLILRDTGVLKFVKYVSKSAPGSRWDISCQWNVQMESEDENNS